MPPPFAQVRLEEFSELLDRFPFTRHINAVHMHHTWQPNHAQYRGHDTIASMWRYHTQTKGWRDIAQHISIAPDGAIWLGRNWNLPPVSASGHNGNENAGPFMFEIIGDFDVGKDPFQDPQRETVMRVIALVQRRFGLAADTLMFHNMMSSKTCPGSGVDYPACIDEVRKRLAEAPSRGASGERAARARDLPFPESMRGPAENIARALQLLQQTPPAARGEEADAEHDEQTPIELEQRQRGGFEFRPGITTEMVEALRPHAVNLRTGRFSQEGLISTSREDVDALFEDHLERALTEARAQGTRLRLLFYAHGGLVSESTGLRTAHKHLAWWRANSIYPVNFIWETGLFETFADLIRKTRQQAERSIVSDHLTDPIIEAALRTIGAERVWSGMKYAAEQASADGGGAPADDGGARYVARKLREFCQRHAADVELHAVGHSAGAVFHSHFLAACKALEVPSFKSLHFLAPAVRVDTFLDWLGPLVGVGKGVDHVTLYTMTKQYERDDNCAALYRKSLLYLVSASAETERDAPLLGLEESLRANAACRALLGMGGPPSQVGEVVWAKTPIEEGRSASCSTTHGGFDDDPATLGSVARRVLGKADADLITPYVPLAGEGARGADWAEQIDWPEPLQTRGVRPTPYRGGFAAAFAAAPVPLAAPVAMGRGRRRALCIGINDYRIRPLAGCIADAELWAQTLTSLGFEPPRMLLNGAATRAAIVQSMEELITGSQPGDIAVIQFAGHGTQLPDLDSDETEGKDEALCPFDFPDGAYVIDDDIAAICSRIPDGVNVTFFTDCCHSGTVTRLAVGGAGAGSTGRDERARFIPADAAMEAAHARFRAQMRGSRAAPAARSTQREVLFSACRADQVAWESNGHGEFTLRATEILRRGVQGLTHESFQAQILQSFGPQARQNPEVHCAQEVLRSALLGAVGTALVASPYPAAGQGTPGLVADLEALLNRYRGTGLQA